MTRHNEIRSYYWDVLHIGLIMIALFLFGCLWLLAAFILGAGGLGYSVDLSPFALELSLMIPLSILIYAMVEPMEPYWRFALGIILVFPVKVFRIWTC